ncbi:31235_t:CDS:2, partial [Gigaspora margarita]
MKETYQDPYERIKEVDQDQLTISNEIKSQDPTKQDYYPEESKQTILMEQK